MSKNSLERFVPTDNFMYFIMSLILYSIEHTLYWFPVLGDGIIAVANIGSRLTKEKEWEWEQ